MDKTLSERMKHFLDNYDVAYTYVHNTGETQYIEDPVGKVCRFCGKRYPEVKFKKKAHAISEALGNKEFVLRNECDSCNLEFGQLLEDELSKYLGISRTISQINGKNGVPTYRSKDKKKRVEFDPELGMLIKMQADNDSEEMVKEGIDSSGFIEVVDQTMIIHTVRDTYTPLAAYKAFVKMALSLLPYEYMPHFIETTAWLKEHSHMITRFHDLPQYAHIIERFIPGVPFIPLRATGFVRKNDSIMLPYYQFYLEFANFSYQMAIPCPEKDRNLKEINLIRVIGYDEQVELSEWCNLIDKGKKPDYESFEMEFRKFGRPVIKNRDMTNNQKVVDEPLDMALGFDGFKKGTFTSGQKVEEVLEEERKRIRNSKTTEDTGD